MKMTKTAALLLSAMLAGCATFPSPFDSSDPVAGFIDKPPRNGRGLVALLVTPNSGKIDWREASLAVRKINDRGRFVSQPVFLQRVGLGTSDETVAYVGKLYPGRYSVTELSHTRLISSLQAVTDVVPVSAEGSADALTFAVESDKFSDAGRLLLDSADGQWFAAWAADRTAADDIERGNPDVAAYLNSLPASAKVKRPASHRQIQAQATRNPNGADDIQRAGRHGVVAASRLASVLRRDKSGVWTHSRVGRYQRVLAVADDGDGRLFFAGEDNLLGYQFASKQAIKFRYIKTDGIPPGQIVDIHWSAARGLLMVHLNGETVRVFVSSSFKKPGWKLLSKAPQNDDVPRGVKAAQLQVLDGYAAVSVYPDIFLTSRAPGDSWRSASAPGAVNDFQLRPGDLLQALTINRFTERVAAQESTTDGAGWRKLDIPTRARRLPVTFGRNEIVVREEVLSDERVAARLYRRGGPEDAWKSVARMPAGQLFVVNDEQLFVSAAGLAVKRSDADTRASEARDFVAFSGDGGATWQRERAR